jgi:peptidoglycan/LPS O-acetylase OafA/YrhL
VPVFNLDEAPHTIAGYLSNGLFIHGLTPKYVNNVVPGGWSIGTAFLFYALLPLLTKWVKDTPSAIKFTLISIVVAAATKIPEKLLGAKFLSEDYAYYWLPNQLPAFALGITLYHCYKDILSGEGPAFLKLKMWRSPMTVIACIATVVALHVVCPRLPMFHVVASVLFFFMCISMLASKPTIFTSPTMQLVGKVSYSMYVWHFIVTVLVTNVVLQNLAHLSSPLLFTISFAATTVLSVAASVLSKKLIEDPGLNLGQKLIGAMQKRATAAA